MNLITALSCQVSQRTNLFSITATPFAKEEMHSHASSLAKRELPVECLGLQTAYGFATRREFGKGQDEIPVEILDCVHGDPHSGVGFPEKILPVEFVDLEVLK